MSSIKTYDAFISYRHLDLDMAVAKKLQELLEKQKIRGNSERGKTQTLKIFRDQSELPTSSDLGSDIRTALEHSRYLIVICSKTYRESKWCMEEIKYFQSLHGGTTKNILPILLEGEPSESFPELLCYEEICLSMPDGSQQIVRNEIEPLAADIRADSPRKVRKKLKSKEFFRIAAPILGLSFDNLYQRKKRAKRRTLALLTAGIMSVSVAFGGYSWYMFDQIRERQSKILENESVRLSSAAESEIGNGDYMLALLLADQAYSFYREANIDEANSKAATALQSAIFANGFEQNVQAAANTAVISFRTSNWKIAGSLDDGKILQISDGDATYLCDTGTGEKLYTFQGGYYAFNNEASLGVEIFSSRDREVTFRGISVESGEVYFEYPIECRPASYMEAFYDDETDNCYLDVDGMIQWYASKDGEIIPCDLNETEESGLPVSLQKKIRNKHNFSWDYSKNFYRKNYDIDFENLESEISSDERLIQKDMSGRGFEEIQLTHYDEDLILASGTNAGDGFRTLLYSTDSLRCLYTLEGRYFFDRNNGYLYEQQSNQLNIYQLNVSNLKKNSQFDSAVPYWISSDAKRCCFLNNKRREGKNQDSSYGQVSIYDTDNMEEALFDESIEMNSDFPNFQINPSMDTIIYEDKNGTVHIEKVDGSFRQTIASDQENIIYSVAVDESGDTAAVAYLNESLSCFVSLYDISTKTLIRKIDCNEISIFPVRHMEIYNGCLLISDDHESCLFDIEDESAAPQYYYNCPLAQSPFQRYLTEDGLLFCASYSIPTAEKNKRMYLLDKIYDQESGECILDINGGAYNYDASTGYLAYQRYAEIGLAPAVTIMRRDKSGYFREVWNIKSEHADMVLNDDGKSLNGNLLLLSGKDTCELYDLESQYKIMETGFSDFTLQNQKIYYPAWNSSGKLLNWTPWENQDILQEMATEQLGDRRFSREEREHYYILDDVRFPVR